MPGPEMQLAARHCRAAEPQPVEALEPVVPADRAELAERVGKLANATEDRTHFSLWAIMAAPLIAGNDIRSMNATTQGILTNAEVIAVAQNPLGILGRIVSGKGTNLQVWAKRLSGTNMVAAVLLNRSTTNGSITIQWSALGIPAGAAAVRDLWSHTDLGTFTGTYTASSVPGDGVVMVRVVSTSQ